MGRPLTSFIGAVAFLTRVPVGARRMESRELASSVPYFPLVGALVGLSIAVVYALGAVILPRGIAAVLGTVAGALLTGAFHEDGLADMADAFGGGRDRDDVLRIMKDPRLGTFGVLAVVVAFALRIGTIATLDPVVALAVLPAAHALSRGAAIGLMKALPPVGDGVGASYIADLGARGSAAGIASALFIGAAVLAVGIVVAAPLAALGAVIVGLLARRKIGGVTGDVLGAAQQTAELLVLLGAAAATTSGVGIGW